MADRTENLSRTRSLRNLRQFLLDAGLQSLHEYNQKHNAPQATMDHHAFLQVFSEVLAPDTSRVKRATATLRQKYYPLPESLTVLLQLLLSNESSPLRQLAATQAKTLVSKHWQAFPPAQKAEYRQRLLQGTLHEPEQIVRHAASRVVTQIAKTDLESGEWGDVFDVLLQASSNPDQRQREVGTYLLFTSLESLGEEMMPRFHEVLAVFSKTIGVFFL